MTFYLMRTKIFLYGLRKATHLIPNLTQRTDTVFIRAYCHMGQHRGTQAPKGHVNKMSAFVLHGSDFIFWVCL